MSEVTPGDNIRELIERVSHYLEVRQSVTPMADTFTTIHDIDMGSGGHVRLTSDDVSALLALARRVSPVTREALEPVPSQEVADLWDFDLTANWVRLRMAERIRDAKMAVYRTSDIEALSVSPPAEEVVVSNEELVQDLADFIAEQRDMFPRQAGDMGSEELAIAILDRWCLSAPAEAEQRAVNTVEELDTLPHYALVVDRHGDAWQYRGGLWCSHETARFGSERLFTKYSPLTLVWVPVTPGEGKGGHDEGCADFYVEYGAPENGVCHVCGEEVVSPVRGE